MYDVLYTWHVFVHGECATAAVAAAALYRCTNTVAAAAAAVRHPSDIVCRMAKIVAGSLNLSSPRVFFLLIQTRFFLNESTPWYIPLGSSFIYLLVRPRFACITSISVITGMHGAKAGVSPPRGSHPCTTYHYYYYFIRGIIVLLMCSKGQQ